MQKKMIVGIVCWSLWVCPYAFGEFGLYREAGLGYNYDENAGPGFVNTSQGPYVGVGVGAVASMKLFKFALGVNIDFLIKPAVTFVRGTEEYTVENETNGASVRVLPYAELSRQVIGRFYTGLGLGYGFNNVYFGLQPAASDKTYTSYQLSSHSITPIVFLRAYIGDSMFLALNYECDIVLNGAVERIAGDPLAGFAEIDGAAGITGAHHRARLVFGSVLSGVW